MKSTLRFLTAIFMCVPFLAGAQCPIVNFGPDTTICAGTSITLNAENAGATYLWNDGSTQPTLETFFDGEYFVEVTKNGCTVYDTINVMLGPVIYADFNFIQTTTCSPFTTTFNEFSQACSASIVDWTWDFGDGGTSKARSPYHDYATAGDFLVSLTVKNSKGATYTAQQLITISGTQSPAIELGVDTTVCEGTELILSAGNAGSDYVWSTGETSESISVFDAGKYSVVITKDGCSFEDSVNVTFVPSLWSDFTFQKVSDCLPVKYQFTDKSTSCGPPIAEWYWEFGDGGTSTEQNPEHQFTSEGQFVVKLTVTDNDGNSIKRSKKITIVASAISTYLGSDTTICFGSSLTLDAGNPGYTYLWSTGETTQQISVMDDGDYSVIVRDGTCEAKDTITIATGSSVSNKWGYKTGDACLPVTVNFTDSSQAFCGQVITDWLWDFGDGTFSNDQNPEHVYTTADSFNVKLTVRTANFDFATKTRRIGVGNSPLVVDLPGEGKLCSGQSLQLDAGISEAEYLWTPSYGVSSTTIRNPSVSPRMNTWYHVQVKKCMTEVNDSIYIIVDSIDKPRITQTDNYLYASDAAAYEWYRDGHKIGGANQKKLTIDRQGTYSVTVSNHLGCQRSSDQKFCIPLLGNEKENDLVIRCSPNPASGQVNILLSKIPEKPAKLVLYDRYGRILSTNYVRNNVNPLNLTKVSKGLYFVEVNINNKKTIIPVAVQ